MVGHEHATHCGRPLLPVEQTQILEHRCTSWHASRRLLARQSPRSPTPVLLELTSTHGPVNMWSIRTTCGMTGSICDQVTAYGSPRAAAPSTDAASRMAGRSRLP